MNLTPGKGPRLRKRLVQIAVACMLVVIVVVMYQRWTTPLVRVVEVLRRDIVQTVVASGRVETPFRVEMGSQITGTVSRVLVKERQSVQAGTILIKLEDGEAIAAVELAKAGIHQAQARLNQISATGRPAAEQTLIQALANHVNAQNHFNRVRHLLRDNFTSQAQFDEAQRAMDVADSMVRSARLQVMASMPGGSETVLAESSLMQARASLQAAQARLDYTTITAPSDSVAISRKVEQGAVVQPGRVLLVLAPVGPIQLVVQIDEKNLGLVGEGQKARASADAYPGHVFDAELASINPAVDPQRGSVEVKLRVDDPPRFLLEDMTVSVDIQVAGRRDTLVVPADAIRDLGGAMPHAFRVVDGRAQSVPVRIGARGGNMVEIIEGLKEGEQIIGLTPAPVMDRQRINTTR